MNCAHCGAVHQRGRFCVGCGRTMPPSSLPPRPVRLAPRPPYEVTDDMTQPVLRFDVQQRRSPAAERLQARVG
ncbi:hypothetical protein E9549_15605 [Blastococcus sp. MG754426]|uniref:hypothetical protein n=1 Tax=unclassified Blastococcus TaxID=2619396 RepID=UPI001EF0E1CD|nr:MULTISPECIES: hypothetical protein [unclassified Blastococcus]MCF6508821.1 hypothetical protein [Blastococcus sp. MG754426]MCF6513543.1 hypothetical protein [Blastococcus sp. MG754427]MCF6735657.1 hypothetical protein [Blastococcus sp. KM273129]